MIVAFLLLEDFNVGKCNAVSEAEQESCYMTELENAWITNMDNTTRSACSYIMPFRQEIVLAFDLKMLD